MKPVLQLRVPAPVVTAPIVTAPVVAGDGGAGRDPELARPLAVEGGASGGVGGGAASPLARSARHAVAPGNPVPVARRGRGLAFDPPQHDQEDHASVPALVGQVTVEHRGDASHDEGQKHRKENIIHKLNINPILQT